MHWYTATGEAAHTQLTAKGAKNPTRPTNIRDAKKLQLLPSITGILGVVANPALDRWRMSKVAEYCWKVPPIGDEPVDDYSRNVLEKALEEVGDAADLGTHIHANIEAHIKGQPVPHDGPEVYMAMSALAAVERANITIKESEVKVVSTKYGYAGTTDLAVIKDDACGILDFKSIRTKEGEPIVSRFGHIPQIAAYHVAYWCNGEKITDNAKGWNVYISTTEPGRVEIVEYSADDLRAAFDMFLAACSIWRYKNEYDPRR